MIVHLKLNIYIELTSDLYSSLRHQAIDKLITNVVTVAQEDVACETDVFELWFVLQY